MLLIRKQFSSELSFTQKEGFTMPDWNPALINPDVNRYEAVSLGWVLTSGATFSTRLTALGADVVPDPGNVSAFRQAAGNVSNAGVVRMTEERNTFIAEINAEVYDEAYNDGMVLVVSLQNNNGQQISFDIPNPDASIFGTDGVTMDPANPLVIALSTAVENLINNTFTVPNSFQVVRGVLRPRKVNIPRGSKPRPTVVEPGAGDNPPDAPAV